MKTIKDIKAGIANKFDKLVKTATNRAIPTAKKEVAKVMKQTSKEKIDQLLTLSKVVLITLACFSFTKDPNVQDSFEGIGDVYVRIDNLTINF